MPRHGALALEQLTIAVPTYNECRRIEAALKDLLTTEFPVLTEVIVVDDGSTDGTWELLSGLSLGENVRLLRHPRNRGKGAALRSALQVATGSYFVPFDADLEYEPKDLPRLLEPILAGRAEVVFGTRTFGAHSAYNFWYVVGNRVLNLWTNILFNAYISDLETCYKLVRTDILRSLRLRSKGFDIEAEITAKLLRAGYRPFEVPINYQARTREQGKKLNWRDGVIALATVLAVRLGRA